MTRRIFAAIALGSAVAALPAGASPVQLSNGFTPPAGWLKDRKPAPDGKVCAIRVDRVTDIRPDTHTMGLITNRVINIGDSVAWTRSGITALSADPRLKFVEGSGDDAVVLSAELVKSYMFTQATDKETNVVVRVHFSGQGGAPADKVYRGFDSDANWWSGAGETQSAFDRAMGNFLTALDGDIAARCGF